MHILSPNSRGHQRLTFIHHLLEKFQGNRIRSRLKWLIFHFGPQITLWKLNLCLPIHFYFLFHAWLHSQPPKHIHAKKFGVYSYTELFWVPSPKHPMLSQPLPQGKTRIHPSSPGSSAGSPGKLSLFSRVMTLCLNISYCGHLSAFLSDVNALRSETILVT